MSRQWKLGKTATNIKTGNGKTIIRYHWTDVVSFDQNEIVLDHGNWKTNTTKTRMNQAANQYGLEYSVYQEDFSWFVSYRGKVYPFDEQTITLKR